MTLIRYALCALALGCLSPAWAINKCTDAKGKVSFQDAPCVGEGEKIDVLSIATYHGPAVQFTELAWAYPMWLINAHLPIDEDRLLLRFGVTLQAGVGVTLPPGVLEAHVDAARNGYFEDVAIWEHKRYREKPILADGDGPIGKVRAWYAAFFSEASA